MSTRVKTLSQPIVAIYDRLNQVAVFHPDLYDRTKAPILFRPSGNPDPLKGAFDPRDPNTLKPSNFIGQIVRHGRSDQWGWGWRKTAILAAGLTAIDRSWGRSSDSPLMSLGEDERFFAAVMGFFMIASPATV